MFAIKLIMLRRIADFHSFSSLTKCAKIKSQLSIYLSTSAARLQVIKVELDSELEQELTNDEKKVNNEHLPKIKS